jgi:hypothetical protein
LQLLLGLILVFLGILDALHQDVALLFAQSTHGLVVSGFATRQKQSKKEERNEDSGSTQDISL